MTEFELKQAKKIKRLTNKTFNFDTRIKDGFFTANYFLKTRQIAQANELGKDIMMQWFQRKDDVMLCGIDEVLALLKCFACNPENLEIYALNDGDIISAGEPVLKIRGSYSDFGFLESAIDAILARRSSVATNVMRILRVAGKKTVFSMADRQDDIATQIGDGYATRVAGIDLVSTDAQGLWWGGKGNGTMPHALVQMCGGDILKAANLYSNYFKDAKVTALVDYNNDVITDALKVANALGERLNGVRVDTSANLIDKYFNDKDCSGFDPHGVCKELIFALRQNLDKAGFNWVKIIVSSGFNAQKIADFEAHGTPVDIYGVGTSFVNNMTCGFTGDLVMLNGKDEAKFGRKNIASNRLEKVLLDQI
ncbi:MAG: nicotinate phosphoribosyltransferase [Campylobacter sp.]|nr:nicotinate phosphoribosyltransferase [Campylobacter sp.]